jgi:hypothetical protein
VATSKRIRRIQGERDPLLKLSELSPKERLEALNVLVRDLKPLLKHMPVQKLVDMRIIDADSDHTVRYRGGLRWDTRAVCVYRLLWSEASESRERIIVSGNWLALTTEGVWIYRDAEGSGSDESGYTTSSSFSVVPKRDLLSMLQDEPGAQITYQIITNLLQFASNVVRSHEQRAAETRRVSEQARVLTRDVVDLQA